MNKTLAGIALVIGTLAVPALSFAQSNAPLTRAEVRADLVRVEQAGFSPSAGSDTTYPANIQAAEAKIAAETTSQTTQSGYGGVPQNGSTSSGAHARKSMGSDCVGPVSFCNLFFGS
ncbi:DUF4148 domain-containing protein [Paraburkholderia fynbosensis]|uniref:DUF4148 domain-containing protein n=1 Tax=Paraburkholderia fynbosensis TaxID=1200993 RepID=A0A6J5GLR8_9BURK|nr:DUF4148 domain-containing protein [Paraburkholderia fynbosensis]CAB3800530.1 hypothetical protein LMG27177_04859 [Paraburkholderia fynbosensis]